MHLPLAGIIDYFQDCSEFQSESLGASAGKGINARFAWVLASWQIIIDRFPQRSEQIEAFTAPHSMKSFEAERNFLIKDQEGNVIVSANSVWIYYDLEKKRPTRITPEASIYTIEEPWPMEYAPRRISTKDLKEGEWHTLGMENVRRSRLDLNQHMNNAQYASIACDYLPEDFTYHQVRIEYKKPALLGDDIIIEEQALDGARYIRLCDTDENIYSLLEFT